MTDWEKWRATANAERGQRDYPDANTRTEEDYLSVTCV